MDYKKIVFILLLISIFSLPVYAIERNGLWGFNYFVDQTVDNSLIVCSNVTDCVIRFKIDNSINISNISVRLAKDSTNSLFSFGLQYGNETSPNGTWLGSTNNGFANFTITSVSFSTLNRQLNENVYLSDINSYYWLVSRWYSNHTNVFINTFSSSFDTNLYDLYTKDFTNKSISVYLGNTTTGYNRNTSYAKFALYDSTNNIYFQNALTSGSANIYGVNINALVFKPDKYFILNSIEMPMYKPNNFLCTFNVSFIDGVVDSTFRNKTILASFLIGNNTISTTTNIVYKFNLSNSSTFYKDHYYSMVIRDVNGTCTVTGTQILNIGVVTFLSINSSFDTDRVYRDTSFDNGSTWTGTKLTDFMFRFNYTNSNCINASNNITINALGDYHEVCNLSSITTPILIKNTNDTATYNVSIYGLNSTNNDFINTSNDIVIYYNQSNGYITLYPGQEVRINDYKPRLLSPLGSIYNTTSILLSFTNSSKTNSYNLSLLYSNGTLYHYYRDVYPDLLYSMPTYQTILNGVYYLNLSICNNASVCFNLISPTFTYVALASSNPGGGNTGGEVVANQTNVTINNMINESVQTNENINSIIENNNIINTFKNIMNKNINVKIPGTDFVIKYWMIFIIIILIILAFLSLIEVFSFFANILIGIFTAIIIITFMSTLL